LVWGIGRVVTADEFARSEGTQADLKGVGASDQLHVDLVQPGPPDLSEQHTGERGQGGGERARVPEL
jgi:hypothetical protein